MSRRNRPLDLGQLTPAERILYDAVSNFSERLANIETLLSELLARKKAVARSAIKGSRTRAERAKAEAQRRFEEHPLSDAERENMLEMVRAQRLRR